jgi:hypothetical protein
VQLAFSVIDETGHEEIVSGFCPTASALYQVLQENGWLQTTRNTKSISIRRVG